MVLVKSQDFSHSHFQVSNLGSWTWGAGDTFRDHPERRAETDWLSTDSQMIQGWSPAQQPWNFQELKEEEFLRIQPIIIKNFFKSKNLNQIIQVSAQITYLDYTRVFSAASKHWRLTDWLFWSLLKHLGMISISFDMFGSCHFFICIFYENHWFFCLYFVLCTFVYDVKFSNWSMTVQMYKTINKKNKTDS